jgi:hypothetical protein
MTNTHTHKVKMAWSNPKAVQHNVNVTFGAMESEVRQGHTDYDQPLTDPFECGVQSASEQVLGQTAHNMLYTDMPCRSNTQCALPKVIGECRKLIQARLSESQLLRNCPHLNLDIIQPISFSNIACPKRRMFL